MIFRFIPGSHIRNFRPNSNYSQITRGKIFHENSEIASVAFCYFVDKTFFSKILCYQMSVSIESTFLLIGFRKLLRYKWVISESFRSNFMCIQQRDLNFVKKYLKMFKFFNISGTIFSV